MLERVVTFDDSASSNDKGTSIMGDHPHEVMDSSFVGWVRSSGRWFAAFGALVSVVAAFLAVLRTAAISAQQIQDLAASVGGYVQTAQFILLLPALI